MKYNVNESFNIYGSNSANWTLSGTAGDENYTHEWCTEDCDGTPTWNNLTTSSQTLAVGVTYATGSQVFDLQIGTPSDTTHYGEQFVNVTVQAVIAP